VDGIRKLERVFVFSDFREAMTFAIGVAELADKEKHHPSFMIEYDKVTLSFWTHKVSGLHLNDFIMAAKVDDLARTGVRR
jgi:4a-hydroxytetrahydrobiopterin dehydratase